MTISEELVYRFYIILQTMASGEEINAQKFGTYAYETAQLFISEYPWFHMPASVHKVLIHGSKVIETLELPLGAYTEEPVEARNKVVKSTREHHTTKDSRLHTNTDLFNFLLTSSDPYIVYTNLPKSKPRKALLENSQRLLRGPSTSA